jgi:hypothetical protein
MSVRGRPPKNPTVVQIREAAVEAERSQKRLLTLIKAFVKSKK